MRNIITTLLIVVICTIASAQNNITIHKDKPYYVVGDIMSYKVYLPAGWSDKKITINNYIADADGNVVAQYFTSSGDNNSFEAYHQIPFGWSTGVYQLAFMVLDESTKSEVLIGKDELTIINDLEPLEPTGTMAAMSNDMTNGSTGVRISTDRESYGTRSEVSASLSLPQDVNTATMTVIDQKYYDQDQISNTISTTASGSLPMKIAEAPYVCGKVTSMSGAPAKIGVLGAFDTDQQHLYYGKSGDDGKFCTVLADYTGVKDVQMVPYIFNEDVSANIKVSGVKNIGVQASKPLYISEAMIDQVKMATERRLIYQQFKTIESPLAVASYRNRVKELKPNTNFKIADYQNFKNIATLFNELLSSGLSFVQEGEDKFKARIYNSKKNRYDRVTLDPYFPNDPIFIVDGQMTKDATRVGQMELSDVEKVGLYFRENTIKKDFKTFGDYGYVVVNTSKGDFKLAADEANDVIKVTGFLPERVATEITNDKQPRLSTTLFWRSYDQDQSAIKFATGDDVTDYKVMVFGQLKNGQPFSTEKTIKVRLSK